MALLLYRSMIDTELAPTNSRRGLLRRLFFLFTGLGHGDADGLR